MIDLPLPAALALVGGFQAIILAIIALLGQRWVKSMDAANAQRTADAQAASARNAAETQVKVQEAAQQTQLTLAEQSDDSRMRTELREALHRAEAQRENVWASYLALFGECALSLSQHRLVDLSDVHPRPLPNLKPAAWVISPPAPGGENVLPAGESQH